MTDYLTMMVGITKKHARDLKDRNVLKQKIVELQAYKESLEDKFRVLMDFNENVLLKGNLQERIFQINHEIEEAQEQLKRITEPQSNTA